MVLFLLVEALLAESLTHSTLLFCWDISAPIPAVTSHQVLDGLEQQQILTLLPTVQKPFDRPLSI